MYKMVLNIHASLCAKRHIFINDSQRDKKMKTYWIFYMFNGNVLLNFAIIFSREERQRETNTEKLIRTV